MMAAMSYRKWLKCEPVIKEADMRNATCVIPYTAHGLNQLSEILKLHQQIVWIDPATNQIATRRSFSGPGSVSDHQKNNH